MILPANRTPDVKAEATSEAQRQIQRAQQKTIDAVEQAKKQVPPSSTKTAP